MYRVFYGKDHSIYADFESAEEAREYLEGYCECEGHVEDLALTSPS